MSAYNLFLLLFLSTGSGTEYRYITVDNNSEISYDFPIDLTTDNNRTLTMDFKTKQDNSFLFYFGFFHESKSKPSQFLSVFIEHGIFYIVVSIPNAGNPTVYKKKIYCESLYKQCSDNRWHSVTMTYSKGEVLITLDDKQVQFERFSRIKSSSFAEIVFASSPEPFKTYRSTYFGYSNPLHSFRGCLSKVYLEQNNVNINIIEMLAKNVYNFKSKGLIYPGKCGDLFPLTPLTFRSKSDYLQIPSQKTFTNSRMEIHFRTVKENCLLAFNPSDRQFYFHNIEIRESKLFMSVMYGSEVFGEFLSHTNVSNGEDQTLKIRFQEGTISVESNGVKNQFNLTMNIVDVDLAGEWYLGAVPKQQLLSLPPRIWSGWLREFYSGCILLMKINDEDIQLELLIKPNSSIQAGCITMRERDALNLCANRPCNEGACTYDWDQINCDCSECNFTGPTCNKALKALKNEWEKDDQELAQFVHEFTRAEDEELAQFVDKFERAEDEEFAQFVDEFEKQVNEELAHLPKK